MSVTEEKPVNFLSGVIFLKQDLCSLVTDVAVLEAAYSAWFLLFVITVSSVLP